MPDTFLTDMAVIDDAILDALGETVAVKDNLGASVGNVVGVFERQYFEVLDMQGYYPTFTYQDADLTIEQDYEITHSGQAYNVRYPQPDGTGMSLLILSKK